MGQFLKDRIDSGQHEPAAEVQDQVRRGGGPDSRQAAAGRQPRQRQG